MHLNVATKLFVISKTGEEMGSRSAMTFRGLQNCLAGGTKMEEIEIATTEAEAELIEKKYLAVKRVMELMKNMTHAQANSVVNMIQAREDLMTLDEAYA